MREPISLPKNFGDGSSELTLSPSGARVGVLAHRYYRENALSVYDSATGARLGALELGDCRGAEFLSDDELLVADEKRVLRWRVGSETAAELAFEEFVYQLAGDAASGRFARALSPNGFGYSVAVHDAAGAEVWRAGVPFGLSASALRFVPGGRFVAAELAQSRGEERAVLLLDAATGRAAQTWYDTNLYDLAFAPTGAAAVAVPRFDAPELSVYVPECGSAVRALKLDADFGRVVAVGFAPCGTRVNVIVDDGSQAVLDLATGAELEWFEPVAELDDYGRVTLSANGRAAAAVTADMEVVVWPLGTAS